MWKLSTAQNYLVNKIISIKKIKNFQTKMTNNSGKKEVKKLLVNIKKKKL